MAEGVVVTGPISNPERYRVSSTALQRGEVGGEGLVYRAIDTATGRPVALKLLTTVAPGDFVDLSHRANALVGVSHPNLMDQLGVFLGAPLSEQALGVGSAEEFDVAYSVAAWVDGRPLTDAVEGASGRRKLAWVVDIAAALSHLHEVRNPAAPGGFVHRDIKPSNIRVRGDGAAVLLDFGVARPILGSALTEGVGTYQWRAPDVLGGGSGPSGIAADAWGLGAVAFWLLVGQPPRLDGVEATHRRLEAAARRTDVADPVAVADLIGALLDPSPVRRPTDLQRWANDLVDAVENSHVHRVVRRAVRAAPFVALDGVLLYWVAWTYVRFPTHDRLRASLSYPVLSALLLAPIHVGSSDRTRSFVGLVGQMAVRLTFSVLLVAVLHPRTIPSALAVATIVVASLVVLLIERAGERVFWWRVSLRR